MICLWKRLYADFMHKFRCSYVTVLPVYAVFLGTAPLAPHRWGVKKGKWNPAHDWQAQFVVSMTQERHIADYKMQRCAEVR